MNRENIIKLAREAGLGDHLWYTSDESEFVATERFAALVAAAEREACAKLCEELRFSEWGPTPEAKRQRDLCAAAIRARGNT